MAGKTTKKQDEKMEAAIQEINLDEVLADANQKMQQKKYREAIRSLITVTRMVPEHIEAWNNLGVAYLLIGDNEQAEMALRSGLEQDPENVQLTKNLIQSLLPQETRVIEGMNMLVKFLEIRPEDPDALYMLGRCLEAAGETEKSGLIYQRVLELEPHYLLAEQALTDLLKKAD
jgi:tetratricopeptide (TPR) repeat protein